MDVRDISLKITGSQCFDGSEEEDVEFFTEGKLYRDGETTYLTYEESEVSGMEGYTTTLKINGNSVELSRSNEDSVQTELYFERGQRFNGVYETPFGNMEVEVLTSLVNNELVAESGTGKIDICYEICIDGVADAKSRLTISVV